MQAFDLGYHDPCSPEGRGVARMSVSSLLGLLICEVNRHNAPISISFCAIMNSVTATHVMVRA